MIDTRRGIGSPPDDVPAEYAAVQGRLARGWNTWDTRSLLTQVRLPDALAVRLVVKEYFRGTTLRTAQIGRRGDFDEEIVLGPHAVDGSFTELTLRWAGLEARVSSAHLDDELVVLVEPLAQQYAPATLAVASEFVWGTPGRIERTTAGLLATTPDGRQTLVCVTGEEVHDPYVDIDGPLLAVRLDGPVVVATGRRRSVEDASAIIADARERAASALAAFSEPEHAEIVRDAIAWNTLYEPAGRRVVTMVSRLWNVEKRGGFAMFCWDAFFGALLSGVVSRDLAYANAVEMLREATPEGFVPNVSQGTGRKTYDGSQPPVGALVCWQLYRRFGETWFLDAVLPSLVRWNRWWWRARRRGELLSPGSTVFAPAFPSPQDIPRIGQHFGATCESGLDGHPLFSDVRFDETTGMLEAHDVGLNAEYVADCEAIVAIARELGADEVAAEHASRGDAVARAMRARLWDPESGVYRTHRLDGTPTRYLAPTSFYAMYAGVADAAQARRMIEDYLEPEDQFGGEWILPSFPRSERHEQVNPYWQDRVWPPMNFLVYLGLRRAGEATAAARLAERCAAMVSQEWRARRHIHENYSSRTGEACVFDNSQPYLTWGALLSLVALIEAGDVDISL